MDWNTRYAEKETPWDKNGPAPALAHLLEYKKVIFQNVNRALAPGCGHGHDAYLLASHGIMTTGLDISELALEQAKKLYQHDLLDWSQADIFEDLPGAAYDMVWEHTCFCAIPLSTRDAYVESMAKTLKPGGFLLGVFFIETDMPEGEGPPFKASVETIKSHFLKHFQLEYQQTPPAYYPGREEKEHLMLFRRLSSCLD